MVLDLGDGDDDRLLRQIEHGKAVEHGGVGRGDDARQRLLWLAIPTQAVDADIARALFVLREVVTQVIDGDRMHAPEKHFLRDASGLGGCELGLGLSLYLCMRRQGQTKRITNDTRITVRLRTISNTLLSAKV